MHSCSLICNKINITKGNSLRYRFAILILDDVYRSIPDRTSRSSLSMLGDGTLERGLPGLEHSDPPSALKESSLLSRSNSLTHLWHTLCWQGRMSGCVKSSLHIGQMSSRSMFLIGTWKTASDDYMKLSSITCIFLLLVTHLKHRQRYSFIRSTDTAHKSLCSLVKTVMLLSLSDVRLMLLVKCAR